MRRSLLTIRWLQTLLEKTTSRRLWVRLMTRRSILPGQRVLAGPPGPTRMTVIAWLATPSCTLLTLGHYLDLLLYMQRMVALLVRPM